MIVPLFLHIKSKLSFQLLVKENSLVDNQSFQQFITELDYESNLSTFSP